MEKKEAYLLPVLIDDCSIPPLLLDIKYADFRLDFNKGMEDLLRAINKNKT